MNPGNDAIGELVLLPPMSLPRTIDVSANSTLLKIGRPIPNLHALFEVVSEMKRGRQKMTKLTVKCLRATIPAHHN
jgi:hypothetical protein